MEILINSLNSIGDNALEQHYSESKKLSLRMKIMFKTAGYKQTIISKKPFIMSLEINNRLIKYNPMFLGAITSEIERALRSNGAEKDKDYTIETKEEAKKE